MKVKKILISMFIFGTILSVHPMKKQMKKQSIEERLTGASNQFFGGEPASWKKEYCQNAQEVWDFNIEKALGDIVEHDFTKILKAYLMFYHQKLETIQGVEKNLLFYVVGQEKPKAVEVVLDHIKNDEHIINILNENGKTVVDELIEELLNSKKLIEENQIKLLKILVGHKHLDLGSLLETVKDRDYSVYNEFIICKLTKYGNNTQIKDFHNIQWIQSTNKETVLEIVVKAYNKKAYNKKQRRCCFDWCTIL